MKKIILLTDGLKYLANAPEKPLKFCDPAPYQCRVDTFQGIKCECSIDHEQYTQALEQAIKEGVKFKDQSQANQLLIANENEVLKQGKLYDIPSGYQAIVKQDCKHLCITGTCLSHNSLYDQSKCEYNKQYAVLEPLTKQEPEKSLPKPEFLRPPVFSDETNNNVCKPESKQLTPTYTRDEVLKIVGNCCNYFFQQGMKEARPHSYGGDNDYRKWFEKNVPLPKAPQQ